jgi:hypothetical protein
VENNGCLVFLRVDVMQYTEYKIDQDQVVKKIAKVQLSVAKTTGDKNNALSVVM